jgi:hypothetical protein
LRGQLSASILDLAPRASVRDRACVCACATITYPGIRAHMTDNRSTEEPASFTKGCLGMIVIGLVSIGVAAAFGYGAQWLFNL